MRFIIEYNVHISKHIYIIIILNHNNIIIVFKFIVGLYRYFLYYIIMNYRHHEIIIGHLFNRLKFLRLQNVRKNFLLFHQYCFHHSAI